MEPGPVHLPPASPSRSRARRASRRLRAGRTPPARSLGRGRGPGLSFSPSQANPPRAGSRSPGCPPPSGWLGSLPCSRGLSPGSILSRRSGEGAAGGGAPTRSLSPPDGRRGLRGAPGGPGSPRNGRPGRGALPCAPRAAGLGSSHRPRRDGAGRDGAGRAGASRLRRVPAPPAAQAARRSVSPSVGETRLLAEGEWGRRRSSSQPPPLLPALAGSSLASQLAYLTLPWPLGRGSGSLAPSISAPFPPGGDPEDCSIAFDFSGNAFPRGCGSVWDSRGRVRFPLPTFPEKMGSRVTSPSSPRPRCQCPGLQCFSWERSKIALPLPFPDPKPRVRVNIR